MAKVAQVTTDEKMKVVTDECAEVSRGMTIRWCGVCWFGFLLSSRFVSSGSALIGSSSPVSRSSSSRNDTVSPSSSLSFAVFILCLLALLFLFWLGSGADHRPHTPTTTPFSIH